ncbi:MAG: hypothetical protein JWM31_911 [Solirubrobacterales bacterium]|nr:hypothetical protein [Solirubrobacterales bacterium]
MPRRRLLVLLVAIVLAATGVLVAAVADGTPRAAGASSGVLVRFHLGGGYVGRDVHTSITAGRRVVVVDRDGGTRRHTVKASTLSALRRTLDAAHLERGIGPSNSGCADCFVYRITYRGHSVTFDEANRPPRLVRATAELSRIADGGR